MKVRSSSIALLTLALSWTVLAQTQSPMRPGNWEVTMKMSMPGMGEMPPMTQTQCITAAMLKDPQGAVPEGARRQRLQDKRLQVHGEHRDLQDDLHEADGDDDARRDEIQRHRRLHRHDDDGRQRSEDDDGFRREADWGMSGQIASVTGDLQSDLRSNRIRISAPFRLLLDVGAWLVHS